MGSRRHTTVQLMSDGNVSGAGLSLSRGEIIYPREPSNGFVPRGHRHAGMRRQNESAVLRAVLAYGPIPRSDIARLTRLSAPSVTKVAGWLLQAGFLREVASTHRPENGRPAMPLAIEPSKHLTIGVHIGLLRTTIGVVALDGSRVAQVDLVHTDLDSSKILDELVDALHELRPRIDEGSLVTGVAISLGGAVNIEKGVVIEHEALGWRDVPIIDQLSPRLPYPVSIEASYRALAEAELWFGVGREVDDFLVIFLGNMIGAAAVIDRQIHDGATGRAGAIAHLPVPGCDHIRCSCGRSGCLQAAAGDVAVVAQAEKFGIECDGSLPTLVALAQGGHVGAQHLLQERARATGRFIGTLIDVIDPARIVLAGSLPYAPEYLDALREQALAQSHHTSLRPGDIVATSFGPASLVVSAAAPVLRSVFDDPAAFSPVGRIS